MIEESLLLSLSQVLELVNVFTDNLLIWIILVALLYEGLASSCFTVLNVGMKWTSHSPLLQSILQSNPLNATLWLSSHEFLVQAPLYQPRSTSIPLNVTIFWHRQSGFDCIFGKCVFDKTIEQEQWIDRFDCKMYGYVVGSYLRRIQFCRFYYLICSWKSLT